MALLEWFQSCWAEFIAIVSSGSLLTLLCNLILAKKNSSKIDDAAKAANAVNAASNTLMESNSKISSLEVRVHSFENKIKDVNKSVSALIDILGLVYVRSKDEDVRNGVSAILNSLKYENDVTVEALRQEVKDLKLKLSSFDNSSVVDSNDTITTDEVSDKSDIMRG